MDAFALPAPTGREAELAVVRDTALTDLKGMLQEAVDKVRADGKASDYIALVAQLAKISGIEQERKDKYDGLKMVNIVIGSNMAVSTSIEPASIPISEPQNPQVEDVEVKVLPSDDSDLDPEDPDASDSIASPSVLDALNLLGSSMVLPDD